MAFGLGLEPGLDILERRVGKCGDVIARCLLYTSDAADERSSVDLGGRRIIKKKNMHGREERSMYKQTQPASAQHTR